MRLATAIVVLACPCWAQFKSTVPLVVAPTTITDSKGHFVDGLTSDDLILYDNNVPQKRKGCGAHHKTGQELLRAALRFARVP